MPYYRIEDAWKAERQEKTKKEIAEAKSKRPQYEQEIEEQAKARIEEESKIKNLPYQQAIRRQRIGAYKEATKILRILQNANANFQFNEHTVKIFIANTEGLPETYVFNRIKE